MPRTRTSQVTVLGKRTTLTERMDPELGKHQGFVETAHTGLSAEERDRLRCKKNGTEYMPIQRAEELRKARPTEAQAERMTLRDELVDLLKPGAAEQHIDEGHQESAKAGNRKRRSNGQFEKKGRLRDEPPPPNLED